MEGGNGIDAQQYPPQPNDGEPPEPSWLRQNWNEYRVHIILIVIVTVALIAAIIWWAKHEPASQSAATSNTASAGVPALTESVPAVDVRDNIIVVNYNVVISDGDANNPTKHEEDRMNEAVAALHAYIAQHPDLATREQGAPQHEHHEPGQYFETTDRLVVFFSSPCGCSQ